ncbi:unnamed protein product [Didymodactylos carnosus]|uniref:PiggyBac transposable element-derived protein domain-containing protein n=1 Tax=Didymodactylos carnosus TaxID=1234261 RepID=A0A814LF36_9BILA|nr:unnamed protein product [Didymodactylos carnosus]CAF1063877.1 unnamed protein product [Didymodactylos carnosus]CAF3712992.1 unnamed protein product [Didymodactylos carnosus]CAF3831887.1 unnamed protein product [Didymodactylos carnosus]
MAEFEEYIANNQSQLDSEEEFDLEEHDEDDNISDELNWTTSEFQPILHDFTGRPRVCMHSTNSMTPLQCFEHFYDEQLMNLIVNETNTYQKQNPIGNRENMQP